MATRKEIIHEEMKEHEYKQPHSVNPMEKELETKISALNYFNNLTESEKLDFKEEIKKRKLRENYASYVQYVFGDSYKMTRFHKILCSICQDVVRRVENGEHVRILLSTPPQIGKGYPIDFPILTTKGWKKHGDLSVGDYVYNDKGQAVAVLGNQKHYKWHCLEITFADGTKHITTREHLWKVYLEHENKTNGVHRNIRKEHILETQELMAILSKQRRSPYVLINEPLQNEEKKLPIDPYCLGLWLGDGCSANNEIIVSDKDLTDELIGIGDREYYSICKKKNNPTCTYIKLGKQQSQKSKNGRRVNYKWDFTERLNDLGVLKNKHIPIEYLLASENQRWELLKGLMDTDGCVDKIAGRCEYCGTNKELCENVLTLLRSLGIKAVMHESDAKLYGRFISKKYRIFFIANKGQQIFKIKRKQERVNSKITKDREDKFKYFITSIKSVEDEVVSCISVEGGMYLAGKELIPTHNSITLTETLPSWFMGRNPDLSCIITAYNADIAEKFGDRNRQKVKEHGKSIFGIEISDSQDNKTMFQLKNHQGQCFSTGIFGGLTSNPGALIIVDDPFKNGEEATSLDIRDRVERIYLDSIETRERKLGGAIIVIHTRWHEDDLIGRLAKKQGFIVVNFPTVWESGMGEDKLMHRKVGETLCPELGMTAEWAQRTMRNVGKRVWNALYQGRPYVEGGNIISRNDIKFYTKKTLPASFDEIVLSCDLSLGGNTKTSDPNCCVVWGRAGANHYMLKRFNKKCGFSETISVIKLFCVEYPEMRKKLIETKANGSATIELLQQQISGVIGFDPKTNSKETRLKLVAPFFESGNIWLPDESVDEDIEEVVEELIKFPNAKHDEYVDTTSQYLLNYSYKYEGNKIETDKSYVSLSKAIRGFKV